jgi:hypothetical protein
MREFISGNVGAPARGEVNQFNRFKRAIIRIPGRRQRAGISFSFQRPAAENGVIAKRLLLRRGNHSFFTPLFAVNARSA